MPADPGDRNKMCRMEPPLSPPASNTATRADREVAGDLGKIVARMLAESDSGRIKTSFDCLIVPPISLPDYTARIQKYFQCSHECFVLSLVYIDRLVESSPEFKLSHVNAHKILLTSLVLAAKFHNDDYQSNKHYARVGGVSLAELNKLETHFLKLLDWRTHVTHFEYNTYHVKEFISLDRLRDSSSVHGPSNLGVDTASLCVVQPVAKTHVCDEPVEDIVSNKRLKSTVGDSQPDVSPSPSPQRTTPRKQCAHRPYAKRLSFCHKPARKLSSCRSNGRLGVKKCCSSRRTMFRDSSVRRSMRLLIKRDRQSCGDLARILLRKGLSTLVGAVVRAISSKSRLASSKLGVLHVIRKC